MITQEFLEKHFKLHNKIVLYTKDDTKVEFTKEPHFHMSGCFSALDLMDIEDLTSYCNSRGLRLKLSGKETE